MTTSKGPRVRVATPADAKALLPLFRAFYGDHLESTTAAAVRRNLEASASVDTVLVALVDGRPAGFASLRLIPQIETDRMHAELSDLYVDGSHRRRGLGRLLMHAAEGLARRRGAHRVVLTVGLENEAARAFYRALGYREFGWTTAKGLEAIP